tara:strand:+ start:713 stop:940 length:228 start_codon:yes stop_codon:yes gene_type:complete
MEPGMESSGGDGRRGMHLQRMLGGLVVVVVANKKQKQVTCKCKVTRGFLCALRCGVKLAKVLGLVTKISVQISKQ